ncbi:large ribosomal subunit protein uL3m [Culicoides brevitarsis]|uniref:large ribosomal subunit protein uL3m n=1 Tax=Culicoides brevitarsis TaxID=469753 RepID=UPI00307C6BF3
MSSAITNQLQLHTRQCLKLMKSLQITITRNTIYHQRPRKRNPVWFVKETTAKHDDYLTRENKEFVQSKVHEKFGNPIIKHGIQTYESPVSSMVNIAELPKAEWTPQSQRTGVIARKIGISPIWMKDGTKMMSTLLQVVDNHVIKYTPPEQHDSPRKRLIKNPNRLGCLLVGALSADPTTLTKQYCGLFEEAGVMPKSVLRRFMITPDAALPPGTPLNVTHYRIGDVVDVRGLTIDRGFQGVMKKHGFKGMPYTHGQTKTHRRPGNIGGGGEKGRVWPGTKLPGWMGNRWRVLKGLKIWRINTKYNVMWVSGQNVPGAVNSLVYIYDTILPTRKPETAPPFPTAPEVDELSEEFVDENMHDFRDPTIFFTETK